MFLPVKTLPPITAVAFAFTNMNTLPAEYQSGGIRPFDDIDAVVWARYLKAKRTTDNKKLAAMLPAHIKRELFKPLPPIKYDLTQFIPRAGLFTKQTLDSHRPAVFAAMTYRMQTTHGQLSLPDNPLEYIRLWNETNNYVQ